MIAETLRWWLALEAIGLLALPIALLVFQRLPGRGYAFAKPLGLLLGGYLFWLALSLHLLPNRPGSIVWVFLCIAAADAYILRRRWPALRDALQERWAFVLAVEAVFTAVLFTAAHLRSYVPEVAGTEKPMELAFLNAAARSRYYPPEDPWFAGEGVSYYYFGYVIQAMLAKVAVVKTAVAFNLGLAGTAALAMSAAFGLGYELTSLLRAAALRLALAVGAGALVLVGVLGNLEGAIEFGIANGVIGEDVVRRLEIKDLDQAKEGGSCLLPEPVCVRYPNEASSVWWWWRATRISPEGDPITEFPFFSFLLGDLHPHVLAIPYVLLVFGLGLAFWRWEGPLAWGTWRRRPLLLLLAGVLLGGLGFLNAWDIPTFALLLAALVLARNLAAPGLAPWAALRAAAGFLLPLFAVALLLYLPFYTGFSSQASGLAAVRDGATRPLHSALFWTPLVAVSLPLPFVLLAGDGAGRGRGRVLAAAAVPAALLLLWAAFVLSDGGAAALVDAVGARGWNWLTALFFAAVLAACLLALGRVLAVGEERALLVPVLAALAVAYLLILGAELFYVRDVFSSRLNTVFKLYYQAWLLLAVGGAAGGAWLLLRWRPRPRSAGELASLCWLTLTAVCLGAALLYPLGATLSRTEGLRRPGRTLDALAYAARAFSDDYAAALWLRQRAAPAERVVEGVGPQYSAAARVASWTGLPAVIGWAGHELQWGREGDLVQQRAEDAERVYTTASLAEAETILRKYGVIYVFVGAFERGKYPAAGLAKFEAFPAVFRSGETVVYRLPLAAGDAAGASR